MKKNTIFTIAILLTAAGILLSHFMYHNQARHNEGNALEARDSKMAQSDEKLAPNTIEIEKYAFTPARIKIKKGTTLTWINRDIAPHTVTIDDENKNGPRSKYFGKGEKFTYAFDKPGIYPYHCDPHPYMKAMVEVVE
jgi:plastocyanin